MIRFVSQFLKGLAFLVSIIAFVFSLHLPAAYADSGSECASQSTEYVHKLGTKPANVKTFPALKQGGAGMQRLSIPPGHLLTPHWHPNSNETTYCLAGEGVVGLAIPDSTKKEKIGAAFQSYLFHEDDIVFLPQGYAHYFANTGSDDLTLLLTFDNPDFDILTLADTLQQLPLNIVEAAEVSIPKAGSRAVIPTLMK